MGGTGEESEPAGGGAELEVEGVVSVDIGVVAWVEGVVGLEVDLGLNLR